MGMEFDYNQILLSLSLLLGPSGIAFVAASFYAMNEIIKQKHEPKVEPSALEETIVFESPLRPYTNIKYTLFDNNYKQY